MCHMRRRIHVSYEEEDTCVEAIDDMQHMQSLKEVCRSAFEGTKTSSSATPQQVSETLCQMGRSVENEARCPDSGYSIDMVCTTVPSGWEATAAAARARGQSSRLMVLITSLRAASSSAGRRRVSARRPPSPAPRLNWAHLCLRNL
jgi:hypothetical protein